MRRALLAAAALALSLAGPGTGDDPVFDQSAAIGGAVMDVATGEQLRTAPRRDGSAATSSTVLPYRPGARYRIPVLLNLRPEAREVTVLDVRALPAAGSVARPAGAVVAPACCTLRGARPVDEFPMGARPYRPGRGESVATVGVDVELCCTAPPAGWVERIPGIAVTYRWRGVVRTEYLPLAGIQTVLIRN